MKKIKLFDPVTGIGEEKAINTILKSHFWASGAGTGKVLDFEKKFNQYIGSDECVAVNSGTAALHLALSIIDIKNKEVIIPSLSFVATAHAVIYNGGKPIFVDIDPDTLCIDPQKIKNVINKKTRVVLPVHFAGMPSNLEEIQTICEESKLILVEDAAHAAGSTYKNKKIGTHGAATCFSFHPVKNLAMPNGGAITLNGKDSKEIKNILNSRRWCGISNRKDTVYDITDLGWNYYMNEFSAAIGLEQLKKLDKMNNMRKNIAKRYWQGIHLDKKMPFNEDCSYHFYWIQVRNRRAFMKKLLDNGIETGIHYKPIHKMTYYSSKSKLPITERIAEHIVSLPIHPNLTESDIDKVIKTVNKFSDN